MRYLLPILAEIALATYCVVDAVRHPDEKPHGLHKVFWILIILFFPLVGSIVWIVLKIGSGGRGDFARPMAPRAPEDDPEYMRWLAERERRRREGGETP